MPESSLPPTPKTGGSGGFIAAALVMLLLMGGLIWWKFRGGEEPKPNDPPPVASTPPQPTLDEPPPPPPPPEVTPDAGKKTVVKRGGGGRVTGGCGGECEGQAGASLRSALAGKAGASRRCYERALLQNATLQGRMVVGVRVGPQGEVCSANITQNGIGDPGLANCVVGMFRSSTFPAPQGGCVDTQVPMNFVPKSNN
jgi:outer membrane biosynthesis protein TonB